MGIEQAIKKKQLENEGTSEEWGHEYENSIEQLKQAVREDVVKKGNKDHKLLTDVDKLRVAVWNALEDGEGDQFQELLLTAEDRKTLTEEIMQQLIGYGIIDPLVRRDDITEIMINGTDNIFIERSGKIEYAYDEEGQRMQFKSESDLMTIIEKIVAPINRKIDEANPIVDARLPDGSRVNVVIRPISLGGPIVTIRKFPENPFSMDELVEFGALDASIAEWLKKLVQARYNIVISGGTGSGKTTFLNALSMYIPVGERIITAEDSAELKLSHIENLVNLETRPANVEGKGEISMRDLVRTALRMRPDRIVVGEVRGGEALDMLQAMNTGHDGSLTTGHANSSVDMLSRLETMVLMSGLDLPVSAIRRQIASSVEIVIQLGRLRDGSRKVVQISEIREFENGEIDHVDLYRFETSVQDSSNDAVHGRLKPTGEGIVQNEKWQAAGFGESALEGNQLLV
ncbi:pilus assembly protein CpaF [Salibacterium salarium]|uniref:CpaF family protein n=1 Tax=Salibacterium salarium TaxID=284579 RepID=UPI002789853E|nr:CpaF family protein [Salibacterium salarium]MDQ0298877.1 pilus assembly protein CpaF [Salibacterium salarium]